MVYVFMMIILYSFINNAIDGVWHFVFINYLFVGCCVVLGYWVSMKRRPNIQTAFRLIVGWMPGLFIEKVYKWTMKYKE